MPHHLPTSSSTFPPPPAARHRHSGFAGTSALSIWLSVDPLADKYPSLSPYVYYGNNPVRLVDEDGREVSDHIDKHGNIIAHYEDGDNSVYLLKDGVTKSDIDAQRSSQNNMGGYGTKIGELGGNINVSEVMKNKLEQSAKEASNMSIYDYYLAVKTHGNKIYVFLHVKLIYKHLGFFEANTVVNISKQATHHEKKMGEKDDSVLKQNHFLYP